MPQTIRGIIFEMGLAAGDIGMTFRRGMDGRVQDDACPGTGRLIEAADRLGRRARRIDFAGLALELGYSDQ